MQIRQTDDPIVITGIGLITSVGKTRETTWEAMRNGERNMRFMDECCGISTGKVICAEVDIPHTAGRLKVLPMCESAAAEAISDARIQWDIVDRSRFGSSLSAHVGDTRWLRDRGGCNDSSLVPWHTQWLPNSTASHIPNLYGLGGPRLSHSTACASSLVSVLAAARSIRDGQCDIAIAGGADAIDPIFAAGFRKMRVLATAENPNEACRPYDVNRNGFVMGEGGAVLVLEKLSHAVRREGVRIYAELVSSCLVGEAHHVTGLDKESEALVYAIRTALDRAGISPAEVGYVSSHGTGTEQNDLAEMRALATVFGRHVSELYVSSSKSMLGHMVNAAGGAELAVTLLAMRDGFAPPTMNVTSLDPECQFDCLPQSGKRRRFQYALKLSLAFGGHLMAVVLRRWDAQHLGFEYTDASPVRRAA
ncbi:MAG: beta-ketoacyl-[acyl-carrier-protein] synthase family protein [Pirellulaceae bacterium]